MATQGPNSPGTMADDATVGTVAWTTPDNAKVSDNIYTTAVMTVNVNNHPSHYLVATNFGFSIPTGATINGILVEFERYKNAGGITDNIVKLVKGGVISGNDKANTLADAWGAGSGNERYDPYPSSGASTDLWGLTLTPSDINASNFGVAISAEYTGGTTGTALVDHIRITVYYTPLTSGNNNLIALGVN